MTITLVESPDEVPGTTPIGADEIEGELARRWKRDDAMRHVELTAQHLEAAEAAAQALRARVPDGLASGTVTPEVLRQVAQSVLAAEARLAGHRTDLEAAGEPPEVDTATERAVLDAEAWLHHVNEERERMISRAVTALVGLNLLAMGLLAARGLTTAVEPAMLAVAALPAVGVLLVSASYGATRRRWRAAQHQLQSALEAAGVHSVSGLSARRARVHAWQQRAAAVQRAERAAERARQRWEGCAGPGADPTDVESVLETARELAVADGALRTARAAHDEALALAQGPSAADPLVVAGAADEHLERLLDASGRCQIVVVEPDAALRRALAGKLGVAMPAPPTPPASPASAPPAAPIAPAAAPPAARGPRDTAPPTARPVEPPRPTPPSTDLRDRVLDTLRKALALRHVPSSPEDQGTDSDVVSPPAGP